LQQRLLHAALLEVIPMRNRAYRAVPVNRLDLQRLLRDRDGLAVTAGIDTGKFELLVVCRWADGHFERPWRVHNPSDIPALLAVLHQLGAGRTLVVALESSGTYGDALRQALADQGLAVQRVSGKAAHDYAESFDGVPSQHDGKDAAIVAELAAAGKSQPWPYQPADGWQQELRYWVEGMVAQRQLLTRWQGRLEGLLARHWPEATRVLKLSSGTLLRLLAHYGSAQALSADPQAAARLGRWGGPLLSAAKVEALRAAARSSVGVRPGAWEQRQIQDYARQALEARRQGQRGSRRLGQLAAGHPVLQAQGKVVGVPTACVLWTSTGDPRNYPAAAAYRKALGLNLTERSSGVYRGQLHISKRASARSRQWLYFAVLRLIQRAGVRGWYEAKKAQQHQEAKRVLVALMRKLALALYHVGVTQAAFDPQRLLAQSVRREPSVAATPAANVEG
jgi:transposase